ncbi:MAG: alpha/beta hydrolase [Acidimicrobiia bacterium]|nr:alpha/beta hydrolase [Acidimicrobiia bacterium]
MLLRFVTSLGLLALVAAPASAQSSRTASAWASTVSNDVRIMSNVTYVTVNNWDATLDVYTPTSPGPHPTILHIHGGGWTGGSKESVSLRLLPYLEMGFAVVNATYRLARVSEAPAAVEDCRCALRWIVQHAKEYNLDPNRIITMGYSAGGHLALTTGMLTPAAGLDRQCPSNDPLKVAAIVNWFGITDVVDLLDGSNTRPFAVQWLGSRTDRVEQARRVSPLTYIRKDVPPVLTIHGDADPTVPYSQATKLHAALQQAGATTELLTIPGGKHGGFPADQQIRAVDAIRAFFAKHGLMPKAVAGTAQQ